MKRFIVLAFFCLLLTRNCAALVIVVDANGTGDYPTIQAAINAASTGDIVQLQPGTYTGPDNKNLDFNGKAITVCSTNPYDSNTVAATVIDCQANSSNPHRGFRFHSGETNSSVVSGLTIKKGYGPNEDIDIGAKSCGGAIFCGGASPTISHCKILNNSGQFGGGIFAYNSSLKIEHCYISGNTVSVTGGGIGCRKSDASISRCKIVNNSAGYGGGIAIQINYANIGNCIIWNNSATYQGGGIYCAGTDITITNCTIVNNSSQYGGGTYSQNSGPAISNSIFWANITNPQIYGSFLVSYSDVQDGFPGEGNISTDPCFVNPTGYDYHLSEDSLCINSGDPCYSGGVGDTDIDGDSRVIRGRVDMGADEFLPADLPIISFSPLEFVFSVIEGDPAPEEQILNVSNAGDGILNWHINCDCTWLTVEPNEGNSAGEVNEVVLNIDVIGLTPGRYDCVLEISDSNADNNPQNVDVMLYIGAVTPSPFWKNRIVFPDDPFKNHGISENDPGWLKFTILLDPYVPDTVYFQDSKEYVFHYDFATEQLDPFIGMGRQDYYNIALYEQGQQVVLGSVILPSIPEIREYGIQVIRYDPYTKEEIRDIFNTVKANISSDPDVQALYFPTYEQMEIAETNRDWFASEGIIVSSTARWAQGNACYSQGWALGQLKYFDGDDIEAAYTDGNLLPEDILLTDAVPSEIPYLSGIITLSPSTPSSHVAILAQTFEVPFAHLAIAETANKAQQLVGKTIFLSVKEEGGVCVVGLKNLEGLLTQEQMDEILATKAPPPLNVSPMASYGLNGESTDGLVPADIQYFGGKAANFGILRRAIPNYCPVALALSFDLWNEFLDQPLTHSDSVIIDPFGYVLFWADGQPGQGPRHADFKLSKSGEAIGLFDIDGTSLIDGFSFAGQTEDVSCGRSPDGNDNWVFFYGGNITPNAPNPGSGSSEQGLFINEFMADNDSVVADEYGEYDDWVEIYNAGPTAIDLSGMYLTDDLNDPTNWMISVGISGNTLSEEIANRLAGYTYPPSDIAALSTDLAAVRNIITNPRITSFSPQMQNAIIAVLQDPNYGFDPNKNLRFRSSTNVEDAEQFTGAGLYDSYSGCLADDLDGDDTGPCACDPDEANERGVFRAIRKVFASFYNDNAFLERLRHDVNENEVGMAILVHHSFPDEIELSNGVATLEKKESDPNSYIINLVTQKDAVSVSNPEDGSIPEEVDVNYFSDIEIYLTLMRQSNLVILGQTVMDWPDDYNALSQLLVLAAEEFEQTTGKTAYILDFEYKKLAPGGAALPAGGLVVKQIRQIPGPNNIPGATTPFLINEPVEYCIEQPGVDIFSNHRLKSKWKIEAKNIWLTEENLNHSFYTRAEIEYAVEGQIRTLRGEIPLLPYAWHSFDGTDASDGWLMHHLQNERDYELLIKDVITEIGSSESPIVFLSDLFGGIDGPEVHVEYSEPVVTYDGGYTTSDQVRLIPCSESCSGGTYNETVVNGPNGISITTRYYLCCPGGFCKISRFEQWVETVITGYTSVPIVLHGYYSQSYQAGHHDWCKNFLFEPQLEPGIPQTILDELQAQDIRLILVTNVDYCGEPQIITYGFDTDPYCVADIDGDGDVDMADFAILAQRWLDSICDSCDGADLTGEGEVNMHDLHQFVEYWLQDI